MIGRKTRNSPGCPGECRAAKRYGSRPGQESARGGAPAGPPSPPPPAAPAPPPGGGPPRAGVQDDQLRLVQVPGGTPAPLLQPELQGAGLGLVHLAAASLQHVAPQSNRLPLSRRPAGAGLPGPATSPAAPG